LITFVCNAAAVPVRDVDASNHTPTVSKQQRAPIFFKARFFITA
jgi:hypothetical protein